MNTISKVMKIEITRNIIRRGNVRVKELLGELMELNKIGKGEMEIKRFNLSEYGQEYVEINDISEKEGKIIIN